MPMAIARMRIEKKKRYTGARHVQAKTRPRNTGTNGDHHNYSDKDLTHLITHRMHQHVKKGSRS